MKGPHDVDGVEIEVGQTVLYPLGYGERRWEVAQLRGVSGTVVRLMGLDRIGYPWVSPWSVKVVTEEET